jgi:hypothetical protein
MFFVHRILNSVTMMYNEAEELTACHFIRPSTYLKRDSKEEDEKETLPDQCGTPLMRSQSVSSTASKHE